MNEIRHSRHAVYTIKYHVVWIPKYRRKVLKGRIALRLEEILRTHAAEQGWNVIELAIQPDHVHLFIETTPKEAPNTVVRLLKGRSARLLRKEFRHLRRFARTMWTPAAYIGSIGHVSAETVKRYIEAQSTR